MASSNDDLKDLDQHRAPLLSEDSLSEGEHKDGAPLLPRREFEIQSPCSKLDRWYLCTMMGHAFHWTECVMLGFLAFGILSMILGGLIGRWMITLDTAFLAGAASLAALFVWGIARVKSLASIATQLEHREAEAKLAKQAMLQNNAKVHAGNNVIEQEMVRLGVQLGLMDDNVGQLQVVEGKLHQLADRHARLIEEERFCEQKEAQYIKATSEVEENRKKENTKTKIIQQFDRAARDGVADDARELERLNKVLSDDPYLKELTARGRDWRVKFAEVSADGKVHKWELLDVLDEVMDSHFLHLRYASKKHPALVSELVALEGRL